MHRNTDIFEYIKLINQRSRKAFKVISSSRSEERNLAILNTASIMKDNIKDILEANKIDVNNTKDKNLNLSYYMLIALYL